MPACIKQAEFSMSSLLTRLPCSKGAAAMVSSGELCWTSAAELAERIRKGEVTPVDVAEQVVTRRSGESRRQRNTAPDPMYRDREMSGTAVAAAMIEPQTRRLRYPPSHSLVLASRGEVTVVAQLLAAPRHR